MGQCRPSSVPACIFGICKVAPVKRSPFCITHPPSSFPAGNYSVSTGRGSSVVEINGSPTSSTGVLGSAKDSVGYNYLRIYSEGGDVQLSQLPSLL